MIKKTIAMTILLLSSLILHVTSYAEESMVRVSCERKGAKVYINAKWEGICPMDLFLDPGKYTLRVRLDIPDEGYYLFEKDLHLSGDDVVKVIVDLTQLHIYEDVYIAKCRAGEKLYCMEYAKKFPSGKFLPESKRLMSGSNQIQTAWTDLITGMEFVLIPAGCFQMGSPDSELSRGSDEGPLHEVCVDSFFMGKYEVTQREYKQIMNSNPSEFQGSPRYPVESTSWTDAQTFIRLINSSSNRKYRLPTEAEWEYAARANTTTPFHTGSTIGSHQANYDATKTYGNGIKGKYIHKTTEVGIYPPNNFGLYDMIGNVWEWCNDRYASGYYSKSPKNNPTGPLSGGKMVTRGGAWPNEPFLLRAANRVGLPPGQDNSVFGFRLVLPTN